MFFFPATMVQLLKQSLKANINYQVKIMAQDKTHRDWWDQLPASEKERLQEKHHARQISDKAIKRIHKIETGKTVINK